MTAGRRILAQGAVVWSVAVGADFALSALLLRLGLPPLSTHARAHRGVTGTGLVVLGAHLLRPDRWGRLDPLSIVGRYLERRP